MPSLGRRSPSPLWPDLTRKPLPGAYRLNRSYGVALGSSQTGLLGYWDFQAGAEGHVYGYGSAAASGLTTTIPNLLRGNGDFSFPNVASARSLRTYPVIGSGLLFGTPGTDLCQVNTPAIVLASYAWSVRFGVNGTIGAFGGIFQTRGDGSLHGCINNSAGTSFAIGDSSHFTDTPGLLWAIDVPYQLVFVQSSSTNITLTLINLLTHTVVGTHSITDGFTNTISSFTLGDDSSVPTRFGNIHVSDVMLWNRALSDAEVRNLIQDPFPFLEPVKRRPRIAAAAAAGRTTRNTRPNPLGLSLGIQRGISQGLE